LNNVPVANAFKTFDYDFDVLFGTATHSSSQGQWTCERTPLMVIECKIGADFTSGSVTNDGQVDKVVLGQLQLYDRWLVEECKSAGAIVLLTHLVDPPLDFLDVRSNYRTPLRSVKRWAQLFDWMTKEHGVCQSARHL
jgi:hypothetical protein